MTDLTGTSKMVLRCVSILLLTYVIGNNAHSSEVVEKVWPDHLRGFCVGHPTASMEQEAVYRRMAAWKVNVLTVNFSYDRRLKIKNVSECPAVPPNMQAYRGALCRLDKIIALAKTHGIFLVITSGGALGNDKINVATGETVEQNAEQERAYISNVIALQDYLGRKYENEPTVLAYNFVSEPHTPWIVANWATKVVPSFIKAIRKVDRNTYLIFSAGLWGFPDFAKTAKGRIQTPVNDPASKTLYGWHDYAPHYYTHQGIGGRRKDQVYPGMLRMFPGDKKQKLWNRAQMEKYMEPAITFMKRYNVRMFVGEFGVVRWAPGGDKWLADKVSLFEEHGIDWSCHNYAGSWDGWNVTVPAEQRGGTVADGHADTARLGVLKKDFVRNTTFNE